MAFLNQDYKLFLGLTKKTPLNQNDDNFLIIKK